MKHLFIVDPFHSLKPNHDSSLALMKAALQRNHEVWQAEISDISWNSTAVHISAAAVKSDLSSNQEIRNLFDLSTENDLIIWMRKDPPVDREYIQACQLLALSKVPVINNPNSLISFDEKILALNFPELIPLTFVRQNISEIKSLVLEHKQLIAKPIGGKAGEGILMLRHDDKNLGSILEIMTLVGRRKIILQEYLPESRIGDKRIFLLNGEPLGAVLRVPKNNDYRANMAAGGDVAKTSLSERELKICQMLKPKLLELGLHIVGLDVIGERVTEINITSPTCLEEINAFDESDPAGKIIEWSDSLFD